MLCNCTSSSVYLLKGLTCGFSSTGSNYDKFMSTQASKYWQLKCYTVPGCPQNGAIMGNLYEAARVECRFGNVFVNATVVSSVSVRWHHWVHWLLLHCVIATELLCDWKILFSQYTTGESISRERRQLMQSWLFVCTGTGPAADPVQVSSVKFWSSSSLVANAQQVCSTAVIFSTIPNFLTIPGETMVSFCNLLLAYTGWTTRKFRITPIVSPLLWVIFKN